jgi:thiamine biosynthesis lipoprotein
MPSTAVAPIAARTFRALGTRVDVVVDDPGVIDRAVSILRDELDAVDRACSRFRPDAELWAVTRAEGRPVAVSARLFDAVRVACDVAQRTGGAVDPTVGRAVEALGYDRDFAEVAPTGDPLDLVPRRAPGWWRVELDRAARTVRVPAGTLLDLGATAKALAADRAAGTIAATTGTGVLVSLGGDVAVGGAAPEGGWPIGIALDSSAPAGAVRQVVAIDAGGLASSSTAVRAWRRGGRHLHHIVDPRSGDAADPYWTLVSATGATCVDANAASTAAVVWGREAPARIAALGQAARLVAADGSVTRVGGWPTDVSLAAAAEMAVGR